MSTLRIDIGSFRREASHDVFAAAERRDGQTAAEHLADARQIGAHGVAALRAVEAEPKSRNYFVEHKQGPEARREVAQRFEITRNGQHETHVRAHRLDEDGRDRIRTFVETAFDRAGVVVGQHGDRTGGCARDARFDRRGCV